MDVSNKTVLLTGAAGGIGAEIAQRLAQRGAKIILVDRDETRLTQLNNRLTGSHDLFTTDLSTDTGLTALVSYCEQLSDGIDVVINAAGWSEFVFAEQQNPQHLQTLMQINLIAPMLLIQGLLPLLRKKTAAIIVNFGSTLGSIGYPGYTAYSASKFGLRGYSEALRRELSDTNIQVLYFAPRATATNINSNAVDAMNKALKNNIDSPEDVAEAMVKLLEKPKHYCYLGWPEKLFVRINSLFPALVDQSIKKQLPIIRHYHQEQSLKRN